MRDNDFKIKIKTFSNKELLEQMDFMTEGYYSDLMEVCLEELRCRLEATKWHYPSKGEYPTDNFSYVLVAKDNEVFYGAYVDPMEQWVIYPLNGMQTRYYASKVDAWMPLPEPPKEEA